MSLIDLPAQRARGIRQNLQTEGDLLILGAMALFGTYALFLLLFPGIPTLAFLFAFQIVGAVTLLATNRLRIPKVSAADFRLIALLGVVALGLDLTYFLALRATSVAGTTFAHQSVSIFMLFLAPLILKERTRREEWIALGISLLGIGILFSQSVSLHSSRDLYGLTLAVLSGLFYALLIILYRIIPARGLNIRTINFWRYAINTVILLPFLPLIGTGSIQTGNILPLVAFAILFAVIASGMHNLGMSRTRPLHASILGKTEPVFAILFAFLVLHQVPSPQIILGGLLILGASIWLAFHRNGEF